MYIFRTCCDLLGGIISTTAELGKDLKEVASDTVKEIKEDPAVYAVDSIREVKDIGKAVIGPMMALGVFRLNPFYISLKVAGCVINNVFRKTVEPVPGSVVYCEIAAGMAIHSGIYVGNNKIVHLNGNGVVESVSPLEFLARLNGFNPAITIYVSGHLSEAVGLKAVARRAKSKIGTDFGYHVFSNNCHKFTSGCMTGEFKNSDIFLWMLKSTARTELNATNWYAWNR